jgi:ubiquinone/menaquinone biosynthesis C-methylase UbiE
MTFWDFCAPFYDFVQRNNVQAYSQMLKAVREFVPQDASVLDVAAGTGSISLAVADKAERVLCTDLSERMLRVARRKAAKREAKNITFAVRSIFDLGEAGASFDVVVAGQVLHLIDSPEKAAMELRRVAKSTVILPITLTKNLRSGAKLKIKLFKLLGFAPKLEFDADSYASFMDAIGFGGSKFVKVDGEMPMRVAVWRKV